MLPPLLIAVAAVAASAASGAQAASAAGRARRCPFVGAAGFPEPQAFTDTDADPLLYHPRFHLAPPARPTLPSGMNDINALFYSEGYYHLMFQDHVHCGNDLGQGNQSFGHVASRDLVSWIHLPSALSDVPQFDGALGPWDGPGFVCNGRPMLIYNSHFLGGGFGNQTKTAAFPANLSDHRLAEWTRADLQPREAFVGPSTLLPPWQGSDGVYYSSASDAKTGQCLLWRSTNCTAWSIVNRNFGFCSAGNPELYHTPRPCDGCPAGPLRREYSIVAKQCNFSTDLYSFGALAGGGGAGAASPLTFQPTGKVPYAAMPRSLFLRTCNATDPMQQFHGLALRGQGKESAVGVTGFRERKTVSLLPFIFLMKSLACQDKTQYRRNEIQGKSPVISGEMCLDQDPSAPHNPAVLVPCAAAGTSAGQRIRYNRNGTISSGGGVCLDINHGAAFGQIYWYTCHGRPFSNCTGSHCDDFLHQQLAMDTATGLLHANAVNNPTGWEPVR